MKLINNRDSYGWMSITLHWAMGIAIIALYFLGLYMVDLGYYDSWYKTAPDIHRSVGVIVALFLIFRLGWRLFNLLPDISGKRWEQRVAIWVHRLFYILIAVICVTGYLITTAEGQAVSVFNWFDVPASLQGIENQQDIAGLVHEWLAHSLIILVVLHALASFKHHFINHDSTLLHMLGRQHKKQGSTLSTTTTEKKS